MGCESTKIPNIKEFIQNRNVLQIILYNAGPHIPVKQEDALAEFTNASVEYMTGEEGKIGFGGPGDRGFEARVHKYFKNAIEDAKRHLLPRIGEAIEDLLEYRLPSGYEDYTESNMYIYFNSIRNTSIWLGGYPSADAFALSETTRSKIEYQVSLQFYPDELIELKEIGKLMQKYITRDLNSMER